MKIFKLVWALVLLAALVIVVQLVDSPRVTPAARFQRLPEVGLLGLAEAEAAAGRDGAALLLLDCLIESNPLNQARVVALRQDRFTQMATDRDPVRRLQTAGWTSQASPGGAFASLAGSSLIDSLLYGQIADLVRHQSLLDTPDDFVTALGQVEPMAAVFPPAEGAITLIKAAKRTGALNDSLLQQLRQVLQLIQADPKSALAVQQFRDHFMPMFELARRCRAWSEFQAILPHADSPDQVRVLTKIASLSSGAPKRLAQVLVVAARKGPATVSRCLDLVMRQGQLGLVTLHTALPKGGAGLQFVIDHPGVTPETLRGQKTRRLGFLGPLQDQYQAWRDQYSAAVSAAKYLAIALLSGLLVLAVMPTRYLGRLIASEPAEGPPPEPGPVYSLLSALAVGVVLSGLAYLFAVAMRISSETGTSAGMELGVGGAAVSVSPSDSAMLSGTVVFLSLLIHAVVWFYVRNKLKQVEDDETAKPTLRLRRLDNLDIFLDLPLFCGLALTVIAFILITLDAGMSRHFAYTSTVVGILSAVSLRIRYLYPLKERLIHST